MTTDHRCTPGGAFRRRFALSAFVSGGNPTTQTTVRIVTSAASKDELMQWHSISATRDPRSAHADIVRASRMAQPSFRQTSSIHSRSAESRPVSTLPRGFYGQALRVHGGPPSVPVSPRSSRNLRRQIASHNSLSHMFASVLHDLCVVFAGAFGVVFALGLIEGIRVLVG